MEAKISRESSKLIRELMAACENLGTALERDRGIRLIETKCQLAQDNLKAHVAGLEAQITKHEDADRYRTQEGCEWKFK